MNRQFKIAGLVILLIFGSALLLTAAGPIPTETNLEKLGMHLYKDKNLSFYQNQSCQTCHDPKAGFADPENLLDPEVNVVSVGSDGVSVGGRNAPTSAYAGFSPVRYSVVVDGKPTEWFGGMFWDGRKDGSVLGDPLAEQAQGPPLNPVEMALKDEQAVLDVIKASSYYDLWVTEFGEIDDNLDEDQISQAYANFGRAIAAYERSNKVTKFSSNFDRRSYVLTESELNGFKLIKDKCSACHATEADYGAPKPLFTTYGYANIGVPVNPLVPRDADMGLGGVVDDPDQDGKFKIPTLRNIAMTPPYSHNGSFATLFEMISFINDRGEVIPEVSENISPLVGNMELSDEQIDDLVDFLEALTDQY